MLKLWAEAIEPAPDANGCDRKIANRGGVNTFDAGVPRGDARRCERSFAPQRPGDERGGTGRYFGRAVIRSISTKAPRKVLSN
jgi:hypothetical protein